MRFSQKENPEVLVLGLSHRVDGLLGVSRGGYSPHP